MTDLSDFDYVDTDLSCSAPLVDYGNENATAPTADLATIPESSMAAREVLTRCLHEIPPPRKPEESRSLRSPELGVKFDGGKSRFSLLPLKALRAVVRVLDAGARKYAPDNWRHVDNARERYYNAAHRHIGDWWEGETLDPETGEHHLAHAVCCLLFLIALEP